MRNSGASKVSGDSRAIAESDSAQANMDGNALSAESSVMGGETRGETICVYTVDTEQNGHRSHGG